MRQVLWVLLLATLLIPTAAKAVVPTTEKPIAVLRALDKVTARVEELEVPIGRPYKFGTLLIIARACRVTPPEETPEAAAFLEISEFKPGKNGTPVFRGWMFASSPALSAMEHPVYDIWVTGCKGETPPTPAEGSIPPADKSVTPKPDAPAAPAQPPAPAAN